MNNKQKFWKNIDYEHGNKYLDLIKKLPEDRIVWFIVSANHNLVNRHIEENIDLNWNWSSMNDNCYITTEFYLKYPDKDWDYRILSQIKNCVELFRKYPDKEWDFEELIFKVVFTEPDNLKTLRDFPDKPWDYENYCKYFDEHFEREEECDKITDQVFVKNNDLPWNWDMLESQCQVSNETLMANPDKTGNAHILECYTNVEVLRQNPEREWNWTNLSRRFEIKQIENNLDLPWNLKTVSQRPKLNIEVVLKNRDLKWSWKDITIHNKSLNLDMVMANPQIDWSPNYVTSNFVENMEILEKYPDYPWKLNCIVSKPQFGEKLIKKYPEFDWDWYNIRNYKFFGIDLILQNPDLNYDWGYISASPRIFMKDIKNNLHLPWSWNDVSCNPNIYCSFVNENAHFPWDWDSVVVMCGYELFEIGNTYVKMELMKQTSFYTKVAPMELFLANPNYDWDFWHLCSNTFEYDRKKLIEKRAREYMAAYKIKMFWKKVYYSPRTLIGQKRLERDYNKFLDDDY